MSAFDGLRDDQISFGYWGNHTATIDWCELNYTHSPYLAEFYNSITNVPVILLGLYGALATLAGGLNKRYALTYIGLSLVGIGSLGFHASLRWDWQLMDELPMIYVMTLCAYLVLDTLPSFKPRFGFWGPLAALSNCVFFTLCYIYLPNPVYHEIAFGFLLLFTVGRNILLLRRIPNIHPSRRRIKKTLWTGIISFTLAFVIWNIDNIFCDSLRAMRGELGFWGFMLQGHGIWHLLTGYGSFLITTAATNLQLAIKTSPNAFSFDESSWFPIVCATLHQHGPPGSAEKSKPKELMEKADAGSLAPLTKDESVHPVLDGPQADQI